MKLLDIKNWNEYSDEDKSSLLSFWWTNYGKNVLTSDIDSSIATSWWFVFGRNVVTLSEWKQLKKIERDDRREIDDLKAFYCDINLDINRYTVKDSINYSNDHLVGCLVTAYVEHCLEESVFDDEEKAVQLKKYY